MVNEYLNTELPLHGIIYLKLLNSIITLIRLKGDISAMLIIIRTVIIDIFNLFSPFCKIIVKLLFIYFYLYLLNAVGPHQL